VRALNGRTALKGSTLNIRMMPTFPEILYAVRTEKCDIAVGGIIQSFSRQSGCDCPLTEEGAVPLEDNVCCLAFLDYYNRSSVARI
jgi:hypothetical protein